MGLVHCLYYFVAVQGGLHMCSDFVFARLCHASGVACACLFARLGTICVWELFHIACVH